MLLEPHPQRMELDFLIADLPTTALASSGNPVFQVSLCCPASILASIIQTTAS